MGLTSLGHRFSAMRKLSQKYLGKSSMQDFQPLIEKGVYELLEPSWTTPERFADIFRL